MRRRHLSAIIAFLASPLLLGAQTESAGSSTAGSQDLLGQMASGLGLGLEIGYESLPDSSGTGVIGWNTLTLSPDLAVGEFGVGLDIKLRYRFDGGADNASFEIRPEDWIPTDAANLLDLYLPKINYVRYGQKGSPLYVSLGDMETGMLGNGFLVGGYDNTLHKPLQKIFGMSLDLDGQLFGFPYVGIETMVGNVAAFDVMGARLYTRPGAGSGIPLLEGMQIGVTVAGDTNPYWYDLDATDADGYTRADHPAEDTVLMYGLDLKQPIVSNPVVSLAFFGDVALQNSRMGSQIGAGGKLVSLINYLALVRVHDSLFIPSYFGPMYDIVRKEQLAIFQSTAASETTAGWLGSLGFDLLDEMLVFNATLAGPFVPDPAVLFQNPELTATLELKEGLMQGLSASAYYLKKNITSFESLIDPTYALIGAEVGYRIGPAKVSFIYNVQYDPTAVDDPWVVTSQLQTAIELF